MAQIPGQMPLFSQPTKVKITLNKEHELVRLSDLIDWDDLIKKAMEIRAEKILSNSGPQPHYRELLGAMALMAVKNVSYRDAQDLIAYYAPAKYLCNMMDTDWALDHVTIFDFMTMLGEEGVELINRVILQLAVKKGFADPKRLMSDTTAQEAKIPYPNEVGLMSNYSKRVERALKKAGSSFSQVKGKMKKLSEKIKGLVRGSHLFAKTKEEKGKIGRKLYHVIKEINSEFQNLGLKAKNKSERELLRLAEVMNRLLPQIYHFLKTGFVAPKKIIHLKMTELYSIVRGKAGKSVEFGLKWGISRVGGGFLQGFLINGGAHRSDKRFCMESISVHLKTFGVVPRDFGFDRGGYSVRNVRNAKKIGIKNVGIAPKGRAKWLVSEGIKARITNERAQVEGGIGTIKSKRYGFNKPNVTSISAMAKYGQRAILGFNMRKLVRETVKLEILPA